MMKLFLSSIFFLCISFFATGQTKYKLDGFIQINDSVYISRFEVSIGDYADYLWTKNIRDSISVDDLLPNPNVSNWKIRNSYTKKLSILDNEIYETMDSAFFLSYPTWLRNSPIVNLNKEQVLKYCNYRTNWYKLFYEKLNDKKQKQLPQHLAFRLPTEAEWMYAANNLVGGSYRISSQAFQKDTTQSYPFSCFDCSKKANTICHITGNIAEMVLDSDYAFGGSFKDKPENCLLTSKKKNEYDGSVGFRLVAVIQR